MTTERRPVRLEEATVLKLRAEAIDAYVATTKKAVDAKRLAAEAEREAVTAEARLTQLDAHDVTSLTRVGYGSEFYACMGRSEDDELACNGVVHVGLYHQKAEDQAELREQPLCQECRERARQAVGSAFAKGLGQEFKSPTDGVSVALDALDEGREIPF